MPKDKYSAVWLSHSSIADFLKCPRLYYLRNVYKDPKSRRKIQIVSPSLSLGIAVHDVLDEISSLPAPKRFESDLLVRYQKIWTKFGGKFGGFSDEEIERRYKERGENMLRRVQNNPGVLKNPAVKLKQDLPYYWIDETDNIILCGKVDWLEYMPQDDSIHIIDFKTSKSHEDTASLQLPIYTLLVANTQRRTASKASYWYLELHDELTPKDLPDLDESAQKVLSIGKKIALARKLEKLACPHGGCRFCEPFEKILGGFGEYIGVDDKMGKDNYMLSEKKDDEDDSVIL